MFFVNAMGGVQATQIRRIALAEENDRGGWRVICVAWNLDEDDMTIAWTARVSGSVHRRLKRCVLQWELDTLIFFDRVDAQGATEFERFCEHSRRPKTGLVFHSTTAAGTTYTAGDPCTPTHDNVYRVANHPDLVLKLAARVPSRLATIYNHDECIAKAVAIAWERENLKQLRNAGVSVGPEVVDALVVRKNRDKHFPTALQGCIFRYAGAPWNRQHPVLHVLRQLLEQLSRLHRAGFVHTDVKPLNVCVHNGAVTLIDFEYMQPAGPSRYDGTPMFRGSCCRLRGVLDGLTDIESALLSAASLSDHVQLSAWYVECMRELHTASLDASVEAVTARVMELVPSLELPSPEYAYEPSSPLSPPP